MKPEHYATKHGKNSQYDGFYMKISENAFASLLKAIVILTLIIPQWHGVVGKTEIPNRTSPNVKILP